MLLHILKKENYPDRKRILCNYDTCPNEGAIIAAKLCLLKTGIHVDY